MSPRKLLYLMHVDWGWIRQRPHFLAEALTESFEVRVLYRPAARRSSLVDNPSAVWRRAAAPMPLPNGRRRALAFLLRLFHRLWIRTRLRAWRPELVWITHPGLYEVMPFAYRRAIHVYDCMDDAVAMAPPARRTAIEDAEHELLRAATITFVSSAELAARKSEVAKNIVLVRNGISQKFLDACNSRAERRAISSPDAFHIAYFGTIDAWLDWDALDRLQEAIPSVVLDFYGPVGPNAQSRTAGLHGPIPHSQLVERMSNADALIMPFKPNRIVEAVDPVKLYEYLAAGRPVVARRYAEIERFQPYVMMYDDAAELVAITAALIAGDVSPKPTAIVQEFLREQTWERRSEIIMGMLDAV